MSPSEPSSRLQENPPATHWLYRLIRNEIGFFTVFILALIGVAYTDYDAGKSAWYWQWLVPIYCLFCIVSLWPREGGAREWTLLIARQVLHWGAFLVSMRIIFLPEVKILLTDEAISFILLHMLTLSTFLAGIYLGWRLMVVALFLGVSEIIAVYVEEAALILFLLGLAVLVVFVLWRRWTAAQES